MRKIHGNVILFCNFGVSDIAGLPVGHDSKIGNAALPIGATVCLDGDHGVPLPPRVGVVVPWQPLRQLMIQQVKQ